MRPGLDGATTTLYESGDFEMHTRLKVANGDGTLINLQGRYTGGTLTLPNPNAPIGSLSIDLLRETSAAGANSLAPFVEASTLNRLDDGITYSPLLQIGRLTTLDVALTAKGAARPVDGSALWFEVFRGHVVSVAWPGRESRAASIRCNDLGGVLQKTKSEVGYTYTSGTSIESAIRDVLDNNGWTSINTYTPVATSKVLSEDYAPGLQKTVWEQVWGLAQSIGWVCWFRYKADNTPYLTVFEPARTKVVPDMDVTAWEFSQLGVDEEQIGNVGYGIFSDSAGVRQQAGPEEDAVSIAKYGGIRRAFWIVLAEDSPVRATADMEDLLAAAVADTADPDAIATALTPPLPFAECSVDLYTFPAQSSFFDSAIDLAPFGVTVDFRANTEPSSTAQLRGKPTAGYRTWVGKRADEPPEPTAAEPPPPEVSVFVVQNQTAGTASAVVNGNASVASIKIAASTSAYPSAATVRLTSAIDGQVFSAATVGSLLTGLTASTPIYVSVLAYTLAGALGDESVLFKGESVYGIGTSGIVDGAVTTAKVNDGAILAAKLADAAVERAKILDGAVNDLKLASLAVTNAKLALLAVDTANVVNGAIAEAKLAALSVSTAKLQVGAVTDTILAAAAVTTTKISDDAISTPKLQAGSITTAKIAAGAVTATEIAALTIVAGNIASDAVTSAKIAAGAIVAGKLSAGAVDATSVIANGIITNALIATGTITGDRLVANTITASQIAALTITAAEISSGAVTAAKISVSDLSAINASFTGTLRAGGTAGSKVSFIQSGSEVGTLTSANDGLGQSVYLTVGSATFGVHNGSQATFTHGLYSEGTVTLYNAQELRFLYSGGFWNMNSSSTELLFSFNTTPKAKVDSSGNVYADTAFLTFSPTPPKPAEQMSAGDWIGWAAEDARKPNKPYAGIPDESHPEVMEEAVRLREGPTVVAEREVARYGKDVAKIAIGAACGLEMVFAAAQQARDFDEFRALLAT